MGGAVGEKRSEVDAKARRRCSGKAAEEADWAEFRDQHLFVVKKPSKKSISLSPSFAIALFLV